MLLQNILAMPMAASVMIFGATSAHERGEAAQDQWFYNQACANAMAEAEISRQFGRTQTGEVCGVHLQAQVDEMIKNAQQQAKAL